MRDKPSECKQPAGRKIGSHCFYGPLPSHRRNRQTAAQKQQGEQKGKLPKKSSTLESIGSRISASAVPVAPSPQFRMNELSNVCRSAPFSLPDRFPFSDPYHASRFASSASEQQNERTSKQSCGWTDRPSSTTFYVCLSLTALAALSRLVLTKAFVSGKLQLETPHLPLADCEG